MRRMALRNLLEHLDELHRFSPEDLQALYAAGEARSCTAGEVLVQKGEAGDSMFVVLEGTVAIELGDGREDLEIGPGGFFGELSFVNPSHRRSGTVVSPGESRLCVLGPAAIEKLLASSPRVLMTLLRRTTAFLVDSEERLIEDLRQKNHELERTLDFLVRTREELSAQELLAQTDQLTGLYNRRCFDEQLEKFLKRAASLEEPRHLAMVMIDLDNFKPINDTFGHAAGDRVLVETARILRSSVRRSDLPCRLGGDEFALLLSDLPREQAEARCRQVWRTIGEMPPLDPGSPLRISASLGGVMFRPGESAAELLERADRELYRTKETGRNGVSWEGTLSRE